ncbi:MAG: phosphoribosylformylglycinamidine cyclo-ligase [Deltaproteobacteria bacterium]
MTYKSAGVNIDVANEFVEKIKPLIQLTSRKEVVGGIGGFGGAFALDTTQYKNPLLIAATDGVGTKLKIAHAMNIHNTVGIDLVAMSVNDVVVQGAQPLFFLDYIAVGKLNSEQATEIVTGVVEGCRQANCALLGGETAEMPGFYKPKEYDLAGFCVGIVEREKLIDGNSIKDGDVIIGLASTGLHSNGFSLARKVFSGENSLNEKITGFAGTLGEELLTPTKIYVRSILSVAKEKQIKGIVHITGGGFTDNIPRIVKKPYCAIIEKKSWNISPIFKLLQRKGKISETEMFRTFNMGIGMMVIVSPSDAEDIKQAFVSHGEVAYIIGTVQKRADNNSDSVIFV